MISKERLAFEYTRIHESTTTMSGRTTMKNKDLIKKVIDIEQTISVLDFGCGKGWQYTRQNVHKEWGIEMPHLYDPYVKGYQKLPSVGQHYYDLVLCVDVMEHILPEEVNETLYQLFFLGRAVYFHIDTKPAIKEFTDGTNFHVSLHNKEWWEKKLYTAANKMRRPTRYYADFE